MLTIFATALKNKRLPFLSRLRVGAERAANAAIEIVGTNGRSPLRDRRIPEWVRPTKSTHAVLVFGVLLILQDRRGGFPSVKIL